jgi:putative colanic acid biosynthesis glycosyltransferase WcaI
MRILVLNQAFYPDVVSTAQHLTDLTDALAEAGHQVTVLCSSRLYDRPEIRLPKRELRNGVEIIRLPCTGLGKGARWRRAMDFATFLLSCSLRLLGMRRFDLVVALTSPPLISAVGATFVKLKGGKLVFWVMDLNPDEAIAAGWLRQGSLPEKSMSALLRFSLRASTQVIALDDFMKQRIAAKGISPDRISVIPPWSHDEAVRFDPAGSSRFRTRHGLEGKYVVMYSGNHSPCHPLDTLLEAARKLAADSRIVFCFVGGGSEFEKVRRFALAHALTNIVQLPYQPLNELGASLSAADLQVVVMGDQFVGIVHPCKIYNILAVGGPVLYIGPEKSHIARILLPYLGTNIARSARHGASDKVVRHILDGVTGLPDTDRVKQSGLQFSREVLLPRMVALLESFGKGPSPIEAGQPEWSAPELMDKIAG